MIQASAGAPYYFATWTGYAPPVRPHNPLSYAQAEAARAFSVFRFDEEGRVASFEKWLATATPGDPSRFPGRAPGPGRHFGAVDGRGAGAPARPLSLEDTQGMTEYFRIHGDAHGGVVALEHVRRERTLRHEYLYWDNGALREFRYETESGAGVQQFDRAGRPMEH